MGSLREFFVKLGLDTDSASFAAGDAAVESIKAGIEVVAELANRAKEFLQEQIRSTVEAGVQAKRMGEILGVGAEQYQKLAYSANVSNVSTDALTSATRRLAMTGIKDTSAYLLQMADRLHAMPEGAGRATVALQAFGRQGRELLPWLSKGSAAIRQEMADAQDLGAVLGKDAIEDAEKYEVAQKRLDFTWQGLRNTVVRGLLPTFTKWLENTQKLVKAFREWYALPHEQMINWLKLVAIGLAAVAASMGILALSTALEGVTLGGLAVSLAAAATAAWKFAAAQVAALLPVAALAAVLAGVYLILNDIVVWMNGGDSMIGKWLGPFTTWGDEVDKIVDKIKEKIESVFELMKHPFTKNTETAESMEGETSAQKWIRAHLPSWAFGGDTPGGATSAVIGGGADAMNYSPAPVGGGADAMNYSPAPAGYSGRSIQEFHHHHHHETTLKVEVGEQGVKRMIDGHDAVKHSEAAAQTGG
jgi:hypothetical protein